MLRPDAITAGQRPVWRLPRLSPGGPFLVAGRGDTAAPAVDGHCLSLKLGRSLSATTATAAWYPGSGKARLALSGAAYVRWSIGSRNCVIRRHDGTDVSAREMQRHQSRGRWRGHRSSSFRFGTDGSAAPDRGTAEDCSTDVGTAVEVVAAGSARTAARADLNPEAKRAARRRGRHRGPHAPTVAAGVGCTFKRKRRPKPPLHDNVSKPQALRFTAASLPRSVWIS